MPLSDISSVLQWWITLFLLSVVFLPLTIFLFKKFVDTGYAFSKVLALTIVSYLVFIGGISHVIPFTKPTALFLVLIGGFFSISPYLSFRNNTLTIKPRFLLTIKEKWKLFLAEEVIFLCALFFWSYVRGFQPDINGLEKYMDFGFVNSILRSSYFPPKDMWFTPLSINYYYFGHLMTAVLTKISGVAPSIAFNLMLATLFAMTFSLSFSIGINLFFSLFTQGQASKNNDAHTFSLNKIKRITILLTGIFSAFLVVFSGNLHALYILFKPYNVENPVPFWQLQLSLGSLPNSYWYPNATRFIHNTIHEFPIYSFVVSDLHGHVLDIPIVLFIIALLFHEFVLKKQAFETAKTLVLGFLLAVAYMTNAWDGIIYFLLTITILIASVFIKHKNSANIPQEATAKKTFGVYFNQTLLIQMFFAVCRIGVGFFLFVLPFSLFFQPAGLVHGIGILCAPNFLTNLGHLGPLLFEKDHCQKSPLWQLLTLYGFFYFFAICFIAFLFKRKKVTTTDFFVCFLIGLATILIIIPEFLYAKDIYPAHYRANTMFKLVYQSFIMLSLSCGYIIFRLLPFVRFRLKQILVTCIGAVLILFVSVYPHFAIDSYYGGLKTYHGLDGLTYLKNLYPSDYDAILWINKNIAGQPVILEAQGDSYTNYARYSANTGLPTVLGWTVHEWLWRGTYDIPAPRITEVQTLYQTTDINTTKKLIDTYHIALVVVGGLERQKYPGLQENKFLQIGKIIYKTRETTIYQLAPIPGKG